MAIKNKGRNPGYKPGNYWLICDRTGRAMRVSDARTEWNGLVVHKDEWESRHPQDMIRVRKERTAPGGPVRPDYTSTEDAGVCTVLGSSATAGYAVAGCAVTGTTASPGTFTMGL